MGLLLCVFFNMSLFLKFTLYVFFCLCLVLLYVVLWPAKFENVSQSLSLLSFLMHALNTFAFLLQSSKDVCVCVIICLLS